MHDDDMHDDHHSLIEIDDVRFGYGATPVLDGVGLRVVPAEVFAILGGNGAGKSTLLKLMLGLLRPNSGRIAIDGLDPAREPERVRRLLAYVPETAAVYPHLTGLENLAYLLDIAGVRKSRAQMQAALEGVGLEAQAWTRRASDYSKGMRQKLVLALAVLRDVRLLLMDEPGSGLDPDADAQLAALIARMRADGRSVVLVSHDLEAVTALADRFVFLAHGRIAREGRDLLALGLDVAALRALYSRREPRHAAGDGTEG
jgi:ABC-2 type transport system ATP-binding protein